MMRSMTGYGYCETTETGKSVTVELKSYNNRYLDIYVNLPFYLNPLEPRIRDFLSGRVRRGKVEVYVSVKDYEEDADIHLDKQMAMRYAGALRELAHITGVPDTLHLSHFLRLEGVLKIERTPNIDYFEKLIKKNLVSAYQQFQAGREKEGAVTARDILDQVESLRDSVATIGAHAGTLEVHIRETLKQKYEEIVGEGYDDSRILQEVGVQLVRFDINEEITRTKSHLNAFKDTMDSVDTGGKKLDFICQELGREINTIGAKSVLVEIDNAVINMKDALEKIREQLRNVE